MPYTRLRPALLLVLSLLLSLALALPAGAYEAWEGTDADSLELLATAVDRLGTAIDRGEQNRAAHPDFLADLRAILSLLQRAQTSFADEPPPPTRPMHPTTERFGVEFGGTGNVTLEKTFAGVPNTVEAWVRIPADFGTSRVGILMGNYGQRPSLNWELHHHGRARVWWNGTSIAWSDSDLRTGSWEHIAFVRDPVRQQIRLYINGELFGSPVNFDRDDVIPSPELFIGSDTRESLRLNGAMSDVRVWSAVRSEAEIRQGMHKLLTGQERGLLGWWLFDEGTGSTVRDHSPHGNHGTLTGGHWVTGP